MLNEQSATVAPRGILRLVAILIVACTMVGNSMITTLSAAGADGDVNVPTGSVIAKSEAQLIPESHQEGDFNRTNRNAVEYISQQADVSPPSPTRTSPSGIELVEHAANNTSEADRAPAHPEIFKTTDVDLKESNIVTEHTDGFVYLPELPLSEELQRHAYQECASKGLTYSVVLALMWRESRFNPSAVGYNTNGTMDSGLMQINDVNKGWLYQELGISNLLDPLQNITAGTEMLSRMTEKHGMHNALMAYQYGEQGMLRKLSQGVTTNRLVQALYGKSAEYEALIAQHQSA